VTAKGLGAIPYPAILSLKEGGFAVLGAGSTKGMARLVDPIARTAQELSMEDIAALSSGELVLITRRFAGAGINPTTFGFRWFWPSIVRYRRSLAHVLVASLFVQLFALATPIFFQLVVDKVLVHKGVSTLIVLVIGMVTLGLFETILQFLRTYTLSHTTNRMDVELGRRLFYHFSACRSPISRPPGRADGGSHARARDDPQFSNRARSHLAARSCLRADLFRGDVHLFGEAHSGRPRFDSGLRRHRHAHPTDPPRTDQREVQPRRSVAAVPGRIDRRRADP
jgi:ATP-binding cassette, subfamily B, bacterial HlyB/CyaB